MRFIQILLTGAFCYGVARATVMTGKDLLKFYLDRLGIEIEYVPNILEQVACFYSLFAEEGKFGDRIPVSVDLLNAVKGANPGVDPQKVIELWDEVAKIIAEVPGIALMDKVALDERKKKCKRDIVFMILKDLGFDFGVTNPDFSLNARNTEYIGRAVDVLAGGIKKIILEALENSKDAEGKEENIENVKKYYKIIEQETDQTPDDDFDPTPPEPKPKPKPADDNKPKTESGGWSGVKKFAVGAAVVSAVAGIIVVIVILVRKSKAVAQNVVQA